MQRDPASVNVLVLDKFGEVYARRLTAEFPGLHVDVAKSLEDLSVDPAGIDVLVAFGIAINDDFIRSAKNLKWIQALATGVDHFLECPSLRSGVSLSSARGIHGPAMRETVVFLMSMLNHDAPRIVGDQAAHKWERNRPWPLLCGKTAVVAGIGVGGIAIGQLLKALDMRVIGVSRTPRQIEGFDEIVHADRLTTVATEADYLIGILPNRPENVGLIGTQVFAAMKSTAYFINVGRGKTVDETALIDCLRANRIAGAALDVFQIQPLPADSPLWDMPNAIVCSHLGGFFKEYEEYVLPLVIENLRLFLAGRGHEMRNLIAH